MTTFIKVWEYEGTIKEKRMLSEVSPEREVPGAELVAASESQSPPSVYLFAPEMLELLKFAAGGDCIDEIDEERRYSGDCGDCISCKAKALITKIEEV